MTSAQAPNAVVMIRPHAFQSNPETIGDNSFQNTDDTTNSHTLASAALSEFDDATGKLQLAGVSVHIFDDDGHKDTPDSVFPNNWFSTHAGGHVAIYPMFTNNRRRERRWDIIEKLKQEYRVQDVIDYSGLENDDLFLEGTGAMVLDHIGRIAYVAQSNRADPVILERFCTHFNYEPMLFDAVDHKNRKIYHTNVMMALGTELAIICLDMISDDKRRQDVRSRLEESGRTVLEISPLQVSNFAGNSIELTGSNGGILALSERAWRILSIDQRTTVERFLHPLPLSVPTIELAGGSVRCMIAGIHLSKR